MDELRYASEIETTYENFIAICPYCGHKNIFNRVSDLKDTEPIAFTKVNCFKCNKQFAINGDKINPNYQILIFDCYKLKDEKKFSYCILNLNQAFEMFFALYLRVELAFKPFIQSEDHDLKKLNHVAECLCKKLRSCGYIKLRALFLNHMIITRLFQCKKALSFDSAEALIFQLSTKEPPEQHLKKIIFDKRLLDLLLQLKGYNINLLRNKVIHHVSYRPTIEEVEKEIETTSNILFPLGRKLGLVSDDLNWYWSNV